LRQDLPRQPKQLYIRVNSRPGSHQRIGEGRRAAVLPGGSLFQLRGDPQQQVLSSVVGDELYPDGEAFAALPEWQADRRMPGYVGANGPLSLITNGTPASAPPGS
jgi:hypothetical protein